MDYVIAEWTGNVIDRLLESDEVTYTIPTSEEPYVITFDAGGGAAHQRPGRSLRGFMMQQSHAVLTARRPWLRFALMTLPFLFSPILVWWLFWYTSTDANHPSMIPTTSFHSSNGTRAGLSQQQSQSS